jgi:ankyrin repeat protein
LIEAKGFLGFQRVNINAKDKAGNTPLSTAQKYDHPEIVELLKAAEPKREQLEY